MPAKRRFRALADVYLNELEGIWELDRRIPSATSRKAWAVARELDPVSVHNWWYRRRPRAKRLLIRIPSDTYELDVGDPPVPPVELVKVEVADQDLGVPQVLSVVTAITKATSVSPKMEHKAEEEEEEVDNSSGLRLSNYDDDEDESPYMRSSPPLSSSSVSLFSEDSVGIVSSPPSSPMISPASDDSSFLALQKQSLWIYPTRSPSSLALQFESKDSDSDSKDSDNIATDESKFGISVTGDLKSCFALWSLYLIDENMASNVSI